MPVILATIAVSGLATSALTASLGATAAGILGGLIGAAVGFVLRTTFFAPDLSYQAGDTRHVIRSAVSPARWVVGRARVGGVLVFIGETSSDGGESVHLAIAIAEGPIESVETIWLDGDEYEVTAINADTGAATLDGPRKAYVNAWFYLSGSGGDGASMRYYFPDDWTADHRGNGIAWCHIKILQPKYGSAADRVWSSLPGIEFLVRGLKFTWPGQATATWTENAARIWYWWLRHRRGLPAAAIDETAFRSADVVCNAVVHNALRYSVNGVVTAGDDPQLVEQALEFAFQGKAVEAAGVYYLRPGANRPTSATITESHIIAVEEAQPAPALTDRANRITAAIPQSAEHDWLEWRMPAIDDAAAQNRDGEVLPADIGSQAFVAWPGTIMRLCTMALSRNRAARTWTLRVRPGDALELMGLKPQDYVTVTADGWALSSTLCLVLGVQILPDWSVRLFLAEHDTTTFSDPSFLGPLDHPDLDYPGRDDPPPAPTGLAVTASELARQDGGISATLAASVDDSVYRTLWRLTGPEHDSLTTQGEDAEFIVGELGTYQIAARHLTSYGIVGPAATASVTVAGSLVDVPEPVLVSATQLGDLLQLVFQPIPQRFIGALEVRATKGPAEGIAPLPAITAANWTTTGERLDVAFISPSIGNQALVCNVSVPETARFRLYCRLVDRWGNYSDVVELGYRILALPVVPTQSEGYWPLWPGTLVNLYVWDRDALNLLVLDRDTRTIARDDWDGEGGWPFGEASDNTLDASYRPADIDAGKVQSGDAQVDYEQFVPAGATAAASIRVEVWAATSVAGLSQAANRIINDVKGPGDFSIRGTYAAKRYFRMKLTLQDGTKNVAVKRLSFNVREHV